MTTTPVASGREGGRGSGIEVFKFRSKEGGNERRDGTSSGSNAAEVCTVLLAYKARCSGSEGSGRASVESTDDIAVNPGWPKKRGALYHERTEVADVSSIFKVGGFHVF